MSTATEAQATTAEAAEVVPTIDARAAEAAKAVIGAIGTWSEWMTEHADTFFVSLIDQVTTTLDVVAPSVDAAYAVWQGQHPTQDRSRFTTKVWVEAIGQQRGEAWEPDAVDLARLAIPFGLALWGHTTASMAHYLKVCSSDLTGTYGVRDIDGYLAWLPKRSEYQVVTTDAKGRKRTTDLDVRSDDAIAADAARLADKASKDAAKAGHVLTTYVWDTFVNPESFATTKDYVKRLLALQHDFAGFVDAQVAALGDEGKAAKREIAKQVSDAVKPKATPRASK